MSLNQKILRLRDVVGTTGLSKSSVYRLLSMQLFPAPVKLGLAAVGWRSNEIEAWIQSRPTVGAV
ncbi:AlpA family transcriptional regulator [Rhodoferax lacus]|uniref:AlpA family transcriptional regulator n=2 Tax=Rhodoferax lacus TaxID=2184758 RepID=A0A3E1RF07_9BURK|nr:AlpA family phage regulatory protein [Rhodoferax lacus]RFO97801.1 AlpA family transcriptional regulator [Rhodoferax lacus]